MLFDPAEANHFSPIRIDLYCFPSKLERQPSKCQNFEAQSHSLFSRCLRLATTITDSHPRLATGGWLDLTRQAFHLLDYSPLSGRTISIYRDTKYSAFFTHSFFISHMVAWVLRCGCTSPSKEQLISKIFSQLFCFSSSEYTAESSIGKIMSPSFRTQCQ